MKFKVVAQFVVCVAFAMNAHAQLYSIKTKKEFIRSAQGYFQGNCRAFTSYQDDLHQCWYGTPDPDLIYIKQGVVWFQEILNDGKYGDPKILGEVDPDLDQVIVGYGGNDILHGSLTRKNFIFGGSGDDTLWGGAQNDYIDGGEGDDEIVGFGGDDWLIGRLGKDTIYGCNGNDIIEGHKGQNTLYGDKCVRKDSFIDDPAAIVDTAADRTGNSESFPVMFTSDDEAIDSTGNNDTIYGNVDSDTIYGGPGDDIIHGGFGDDKIISGPGKDELVGQEYLQEQSKLLSKLIKDLEKLPRELEASKKSLRRSQTE